MINFSISTITPENEEINVFYDFSNGETNSHKFLKNATFLDIMKWGNKRVIFFEDREVELQRIAEQLKEDIIIDSQTDGSINI